MEQLKQNTSTSYEKVPAFIREKIKDFDTISD